MSLLFARLSVSFAFPTSSALPVLRGKEFQIIGMSLVAAIVSCFSMVLIGYLLLDGEKYPALGKYFLPFKV